MKTFREYLIEVESEGKGTYASLKLKPTSQKRLSKWLKATNITTNIDPEEYHCTVVYSRKYLPELETKEVHLPQSATVSGWEKLGNTLVLLLESKSIEKLHTDAKKMGATHDFPEFIPHVSIASDYTGELPEEIPDFKLFFNEYKVEELDTEYSY